MRPRRVKTYAAYSVSKSVQNTTAFKQRLNLKTLTFVCRDCAVHGPALERSEDIREARRESVSSRRSSSSSVFSDMDMVDRWRRSTSQVRILFPR